jgi:hypothetical protein
MFNIKLIKYLPGNFPSLGRVVQARAEPLVADLEIQLFGVFLPDNRARNRLFPFSSRKSPYLNVNKMWAIATQKQL